MTQYHSDKSVTEHKTEQVPSSSHPLNVLPKIYFNNFNPHKSSCLQICLFHKGFPMKILCDFRSSPIQTTPFLYYLFWRLHATGTTDAITMQYFSLFYALNKIQEVCITGTLALQIYKRF